MKPTGTSIPEERIKQRVQCFIVCISGLILLGKFFAYWITNSVGILTDAMESIVNVAAGAVSLYSLHYAARPQDREHPFGHGKMELLSASLEALLIFMAGAFIIIESIQRLFHPGMPQQLDLGIWIVAAGGLFNFLMGSLSIHMGRKYNSIALVAGGKHLHSDVYSTLGLIAGLLILHYTRMAWIDSLLGLVFGGLILLTGIGILRRTTSGLLDRADEDLLRHMAQTLQQHRRPEWIDVHNAKILKSGNRLFIECDLTLPWYYSLVRSHQACEDLQHTLSEDFKEQTQISIHSDPCFKHEKDIRTTPPEQSPCTYCAVNDCPSRKHAQQTTLPLSLSAIILNDEERKSAKQGKTIYPKQPDPSST